MSFHRPRVDPKPQDERIEYWLMREGDKWHDCGQQSLYELAYCLMTKWKCSVKERFRWLKAHCTTHQAAIAENRLQAIALAVAPGEPSTYSPLIEQ